MAEQEVRKNLKKIVDITRSKEHSFIHKLKEILVEILIIVFAVSITIYFHSISEHHHEQKEVKTFLLGLKEDIKKDVSEMYDDIEAYKKQKALFNYLSNLPDGKPANKDSIAAYQQYLFNFTSLVKEQGRYEGFKSSGKIGFIEDDDLRNRILDLYEEDIPILNISTDFYKTQKLKFADYLMDNANNFPNGNLMEVISKAPIKNRCKIYLSSVDNIISNYQDCIDAGKQIISEIDEDNKH